jgi:hypothetical protein
MATGCITSTVSSLKLIIIVQESAGQSHVCSTGILVKSSTPGKKYYITSFSCDDAEAVSEMEVCFNLTNITAQADC